MSCFEEIKFFDAHFCFAAVIKQNCTSSRIEPPHLNNFAYKIHPYKIIYFLSLSKTLYLRSSTRVHLQDVQLAHSTKKLWENENSIEYRISFHPKKFFGVNPTPKILVNVATSFSK